MIRLLFWVVLAPLRAIRWLVRRLYVAFWGYDVLRLRLRGSLPDRRIPRGLLGALGSPAGPALIPTLGLLDRASRDRRLRAVLVELGPLHCGAARAEEIADALRRVRESKKRVIVYAEQAGLTEYIAALGAGEIVLAPSGSLDVAGVASEVLFLKGVLDKVGVHAQLVARGKYKTARETFAEPAMTPANREMTEAIVGDLYDQLVARIAASRQMTPDAVRATLEDGPFMASRAVEARLVDRVGYLEDIEKELKESFGRDRMLEAKSYHALSTHAARKGSPASVALIEVTGHIKSGRSVPGPSGPRATGSRTFQKQVEHVAKNSRIRAVLLRVDSPGGSALASDLMWHALGKLADKPIVVSMGNVAASGGYFVSGVKGATVLASDMTITGSIGVLGGKFEARELYDRLGAKKEIVRRGAHAAYLSDYEPFSPEELVRLEGDIDAHYRDFVTKMAEGRGRSYDEIHDVAQGRVWTGRQAGPIGLVDESGGLLAALDRIRQRLEIKQDAPIELMTPPGEGRRLGLRGLLSESSLPIADAALGPLRLAEYFRRDRVLALLPFDLRFR